MSDVQKAKYLEEREKVLDEWDEIELKFRDGCPVRIEMTGDSMDLGDGPVTQVIGFQPTKWSDAVPGDEDRLVQRMMNDDYELEKASVLSFNPSDARNNIMLRCLCRPAQGLTDELIQEKQILIAMSRKPYNPTTHWQILFEFYRTTAGYALEDESLANECPSLGSHWEIVGFQGTNPATDLRGVGVLGLLQLYCFVHDTQEDKLQPIVKLSRKEPNDFPLAVIGLNFTSLILTRLRSNDLNQGRGSKELTWAEFCQTSGLEIAGVANFCGGFLVGINQIYRGCFVYFTEKWKKDNCSIKDVQTILNEIQSLLKRDPWKLVKQSATL